MALPLIPTMLILGACVGLVGSGITFRITHNLKATVLMFVAVFAFAALYATLLMLQSSIVWQ